MGGGGRVECGSGWHKVRWSCRARSEGKKIFGLDGQWAVQQLKIPAGKQRLWSRRWCVEEWEGDWR